MNIEREFLIKFCIFYGEPVRTARESQASSSAPDHVTIYELKHYWDGLILLVENRHASRYVHFHFRCIAAGNAFFSRRDASRELFDVIPPNHRQIVVAISRRHASHAFNFGHDFQYTLSSQKVLKQPEAMQHKHWSAIDETPTSDDIHLPQMIASAHL
jgi:hypothetical protein